MSTQANQQQQNEQLLQYLNQQMESSEAQQLEEKLLEDPFAQEATEGLLQLGSNAAIQQKVYHLNKDLEKKLMKHGERRRKPSLINKQLPWQALAVIIVLGLCIAGYYLIREYLQHLSR